MLKLTLLVATLLLCTLSQELEILRLLALFPNKHAFRVYEVSELTSVESIADMRRVEEFAKEDFKKKNSDDKLDILINVLKQYDVGFTYRMVFRSEKGDIYQYEVNELF